MKHETWKPISGYESYEVSSLGRVRSIPRVEAYRNRRRKGTMMALSHNQRGYVTVRLCKDGAETRHAVHSLVLRAFVGQCPSGRQGCHKDGDKENNAALNLRWGSPSENNNDKIDHGTIARGIRHGMCRHEEKKAREVKRLLSEGVGTSVIARKLGVSVQFASHIKFRRTWKWL